jgi:hypothetical protein
MAACANTGTGGTATQPICPAAMPIFI